jgi:hypothetical protein
MSEFLVVERVGEVWGIVELEMNNVEDKVWYDGDVPRWGGLQCDGQQSCSGGI